MKRPGPFLWVLRGGKPAVPRVASLGPPSLSDAELAARLAEGLLLPLELGILTPAQWGEVRNLFYEALERLEGQSHARR